MYCSVAQGTYSIVTYLDRPRVGIALEIVVICNLGGVGDCLILMA